MNPYNRLSMAFVRDHPDMAAQVLEGFPAEEVAGFLATMGPVTAAGIVAHFTPGFAASCLQAGETPVAGEIFTRLLPDLQIVLLRQLDRDIREALLATLKPDQANYLRRLIPYPEGTAGALMQAPMVTVSDEVTVRDAVKRVKRIRRGMKFYVYVTNKAGQLVGVLTLHELINAPPASVISQVMHRQLISLSPEQSAQSVSNSPYWQEYYALPVTDEDNILLGVIRHKTIRRIQEQLTKQDAISEGLGLFMSAGALFSTAAAFSLSTLIATGTSLTQDSRD